MGHTAAETSPKYDQPFFPCGVPQLEQLHPLQVKQWAGVGEGQCPAVADSYPRCVSGAG